MKSSVLSRKQNGSASPVYKLLTLVLNLANLFKPILNIKSDIRLKWKMMSTYCCHFNAVVSIQKAKVNKSGMNCFPHKLAHHT